MIPARLLPNTVRIEKRAVSQNSTNEIVESWDGDEEIAASVQDRTPSQLLLPDQDGPVLVSAVIFTEYRSDIEHLDRLFQTDVDPERGYSVIFANDPAGRHHHLELQCQRIVPAEETVS